MLPGREGSLGELQSTLDSCVRRQRSHVTLLSGSVGSGKTTLVETFGRHAANSSARFLIARASAAARDVRFGIIGQLFGGAPIDAHAAGRISRLLTGDSFAGPLPEPGSAITQSMRPTGEPARHTVLQQLSAALVDLGAHRPLVLAVDDVHDADLASLHCLLYLVRRLRYARVAMLVVLTESAMVQPPHPVFRAELLSQPHTSRMNLPPLPREVLAQMVTEAGLEPVAEVTGRCLELTGGNPMLARALLGTRTAGPAHSGRPEDLDDSGFGRAVLDCLHRHEPLVREAAEALAMLPGPVSVEVLSQFLDVVPAFARRALAVLEGSGLVQRGQLRHDLVRRSVLADIAPPRRRRLHEQAAAVLDEHGADPSVVAEHLLAADSADADWARTALKEAAAQALAGGRPDQASAYLRLARRSAPDPAARVGILAMLVRAHWQTNPADAEDDLAELVREARGLDPGEHLAAVPFLLWLGRFDTVNKILCPAATPDADDPSGPPDLARLMTAIVRPGYGLPDRQRWARLAHQDGAALTSDPLREALTVLAGSMVPTPDEDVVTSAEEVLQRYQSRRDMIGPLTAPLMALLYAGRADRTAVWADQFLLQAPMAKSHSWQAVLRAIRAEAALRLGDLRLAERYACDAWEVIRYAWGVAAAGPLATLVQCALATGRLEEAERWLAVRTIPEVFETPLGLQYLDARGAYHLAAGSPELAREDLRRCRDLMLEWRTDVTGIVPWRIGLARVHLALGELTQARDLLHEQLYRCAAVDHRTQGRALRLLAGMAPPEQRRALLGQAVTHLQLSGDRVELARALGDGGRRLLAARQPARARRLLRRAYHLAQECGASGLAQHLLRNEPALADAPHPHPADQVDLLSEAERRVATLAAQGHTNRQIAGLLFITVSTVEQHLTKVYRKLDVKRRADLRDRLANSGDASAALPGRTRLPGSGTNRYPSTRAG